MYEIISVASYFIRQFCLPNPFENIQNGIMWNWIAGGIIGVIAYAVTGELWIRTSEGRSFSYLLQYVVLIFILWITHKVFWILGLILAIGYFAIVTWAINRRF